MAAAACTAASEPPHAPYVPLARIEAVYGRLVTAGNYPTPDQHGTGDRVGLFRAADGTIWGLPLTIDSTGALRGCAPPAVRQAPATDTLPPGVTDVVGTTNAPTGWRGGTGELELLIRAADGALRWTPVAAGDVADGPVCVAQSPPSPRRPLRYYRLVAPGAR